MNAGLKCVALLSVLLVAPTWADSMPILASEVTQQCPAPTRAVSISTYENAESWAALHPFDPEAGAGVFGRRPDWQKEFIAILNLGARPNLGYSMSLAGSHFSRKTGLLTLSIREHKSAPDAQVAQALAQPCALLLLPRGTVRRIEIRDAGRKKLLAQHNIDHPKGMHP